MVGLTTQAGRRRQRSYVRMASQRLSNELLLERAAMLSEEERNLLTMHLVHGVSQEELASVARVSERQMRRRLETIRRKLGDRWFLLTVRYGRLLSPPARELAEARWAQVRPLRTIAAERGITLHQLREMLKVIQGQMLFMAGYEEERRAEASANDAIRMANDETNSNDE